MNGVAMRTERALADWLAAQDWSASPLGTAVPVHPIDRTCELDVTATLQLSADDTSESDALLTVAAFENILQPLFVDDNISDLNTGDDDPSGGFTAFFATPTDFGVNDTSERARTFSRSMTIFAAANANT